MKDFGFVYRKRYGKPKSAGWVFRKHYRKPRDGDMHAAVARRLGLTKAELGEVVSLEIERMVTDYLSGSEEI